MSNRYTMIENKEGKFPSLEDLINGDRQSEKIRVPGKAKMGEGLRRNQTGFTNVNKITKISKEVNSGSSVSSENVN